MGTVKVPDPVEDVLLISKQLGPFTRRLGKVLNIRRSSIHFFQFPHDLHRPTLQRLALSVPDPLTQLSLVVTAVKLLYLCEDGRLPRLELGAFLGDLGVLLLFLPFG